MITNPVCKHIAKALRANAQTKTLLKSLQSRPNLPTGHWGFAHAQKKQNKFVFC